MRKFETGKTYTDGEFRALILDRSEDGVLVSSPSLYQSVWFGVSLDEGDVESICPNGHLILADESFAIEMAIMGNLATEDGLTAHQATLVVQRLAREGYEIVRKS